MSVEVIEWEKFVSKELGPDQQPCFDEGEKYLFHTAPLAPFLSQVRKQVDYNVAVLPRAHFKSPEGRTCVFQAMAHIAPAEFYVWCIQQIEEIGDAYLYEGIRLPTEVAENTGGVVSELLEYSDPKFFLLEAMRAVRETDYLPCRTPKAVHADIGIEFAQAAEVIMKTTPPETARASMSLLARFPLFTARRLIEQANDVILEDPAEFRDLTTERDQKEEELVLELRNSHLLKVILAQRGDVYVQYGSNHLVGMVEKLLSVGWQLNKIDLVKVTFDFKQQRLLVRAGQWAYIILYLNGQMALTTLHQKLKYLLTKIHFKKPF